MARTVSPIGVYASQSGMVAATPSMKSDLPARPREIARYMATMDSTEMMACRLRSCPGCSVSRRPVSSSVRTSAASSSNGQAASTPTIAAVQR